VGNLPPLNAKKKQNRLGGGGGLAMIDHDTYGTPIGDESTRTH